MSFSQLPNVVNPNTRNTPNLFDGNNFREWVYLGKQTIICLMSIILRNMI